MTAPPDDLATWAFETSDGIELQIRHATAPAGRSNGRHVVLIHGASAAYTTFLVPSEASLASALLGEGFDVWFLDWRGSHFVSRKYLLPAVARKYKQRFRLDLVSQIDFPEALRKICELAQAKSLDVVAHCLGSGALAQSLAGGHLRDLRFDHVVFSTLGLFYEVTFDNAMKAKDFVLERIAPHCDYVAPDQDRWPDDLERDYREWKGILSPGCDPLCHNELCFRLCFMYGIPYFHDQLTDELHDASKLKAQFGPIPIEMYIQAGQNVRRRWAAPYGSPGDCDDYVTDGARSHFAGTHVTLITGTHNTLWHRDSIDRMYEWLRRGAVLRGPETPARDGQAGSVEKVVFRKFGHQDLLWGKDAPRSVFPEIVRALRK